MYEAFYGFREPPFRVTPDPRFLYRNAATEEAVAALTYGVEQRKGFLSLVGEVGTGKTTLLRHLLELGRAHHQHRSPALTRPCSSRRCWSTSSRSSASRPRAPESSCCSSASTTSCWSIPA